MSKKTIRNKYLPKRVKKQLVKRATGSEGIYDASFLHRSGIPKGKVVKGEIGIKHYYGKKFKK